MATKLSLPPELQRLIAEKVESGRYASPAEVIREALALLQERDEEQSRLQRLREEIQAGLEQLERGRFSTYDDATLPRLTEEIQAEGRRKRDLR